MKKLVKSAIHTYWLEKLRSEANLLPSLTYFKTGYLGLSKCHPIFRVCGSSPWEIEKACVQMRLLLGRYRFEALTKHWLSHKFWLLPSCSHPSAKYDGNIESFFVSCYSLNPAREKFKLFFSSYLTEFPFLSSLTDEFLALNSIKFYLDPSTMPPVISMVQEYGEEVLYHLFKITRNYCFLLHELRNKLLANS